MSSRKLRGIKISLLAVLALVVIITLFFVTKAKQEVDEEILFTMSSNAERVKFLNEQGLIVNPDPIAKEEIIIPSEANSTYEEYVKILESQGFNIKPYAGRTVLRISYEVLNYPDFPDGVTANMLIADDRLIGGDISMSGEDGFIRPLLTNKSTWELKEQNSCNNPDCQGCQGDCENCPDCSRN